MENLDPVVENQDPVAPAAPVAKAPAFSWKSQIDKDLASSPTLQKFADTSEGLGEAVKSYASLEKLLGHEKVPIPKDANDVEGWSRFSKAMGIPDKAEGYGLPDVDIPENLKGLSFNKQQFAEIVHAHKLTPAQAKGLWEAYTNLSKEAYSKALAEHQKSLENVVNQLRSKWGDTYEANINLGQTVINKFAGSKEENDYLTSILTKDARAVEFLARIGNEFAENKVGEFSHQRFSLAPEEAQREIDKITSDPNHPYLNDKAKPFERDAAISYVNSLYAIIQKAKQ